MIIKMINNNNKKINNIILHIKDTLKILKKIIE